MLNVQGCARVSDPRWHVAVPGQKYDMKSRTTLALTHRKVSGVVGCSQVQQLITAVHNSTTKAIRHFCCISLAYIQCEIWEYAMKEVHLVCLLLVAMTEAVFMGHDHNPSHSCSVATWCCWWCWCMLPPDSHVYQQRMVTVLATAKWYGSKGWKQSQACWVPHVMSCQDA